MNPAKLKRALQILDEASELQGDDRDRFIKGSCDQDDELRREIDSMLCFDGEIFIEDVTDEAPLFQWPGQPTEHRYQLLDEIARGGMGIIYRARDDFLGREVAIKVLLNEYQDDPNMLHRLFYEARIGAVLQHPGIAPIYDMGVLPDQGPFFAMKLVRGTTLAVALDQDRTMVDKNNLISVFERLCQTVAFAHSKGIIHRDLKPENIMLGQFGDVQLMDWGVAKNIGHDQSLEAPNINDGSYSRGTDHSDSNDERTTTPVTRYGQVIGTPDYMAPEQVAGIYDKTTDVYSLGVVLCEILLDRPFKDHGNDFANASDNKIGFAHSEKLQRLIDQVDQNEFDRQLIEIAIRCLETSSAKRFPDAKILAEQVSAFLVSAEQRVRSAEVELVRAQTIAAEESKQKRLTVAVFSLLLVLVLTGALFWSWNTYKNYKHESTVAALERESALAAESESYRTAIAAAFLAYETKQFDRAHQILMDAPKKFRNWEWKYLLECIDESLNQFEDVDNVEFVRLLPGTEHVQLLETGGAVRVVNRWDGEQLSYDHFAKGKPIGVSRNGRWLVVNDQKSCQLWSIEEREMVKSFDMEDVDAATHTAISSDGKNVALRSLHGRLKVFDSSNGNELAAFDGCQCNAMFDENSNLIWASEGAIRIWDINKSVTSIASLPLAEKLADPFQVSVSTDGRTLAASFESHIQVWKLGNEPTSFQLTTSEDVRRMVFDQSGRRLFLILIDGKLQIWDRDSQELSVELESPGGLAAWASDLSVDGELICTLVAEPPMQRPGTPNVMKREVRIWHAETESSKVLSGHSGFVYPVSFSPKGSRIASGSWDRSIRFWNAENGKEIAELWPNSGEILSLSFNCSGDRLVAGTMTGDVILMDTQNGDILAKKRMMDRCYSVAFGKNDSAILVATGGLFELDSQSLVIKSQLVEQLTPGQKGLTTEIVFSKDQSRFATFSGKSSWDPRNEVVIWDSNLLEPVHLLTAPYLVQYASFSPDGSQFALSHINGLVTLWNSNDFSKPVMTIDGHLNEVFALQFINDSRLVTGGKDGKILIWDIRSGQQLGLLPGHTDYVYNLDLSPCGTRLISGSGDKTIRIWETNPLLQRLESLDKAKGLHSRVEKLVTSLLDDETATDSLIDRIKKDKRLSSFERRLALDEVLRQGSSSK